MLLLFFSSCQCKTGTSALLQNFQNLIGTLLKLRKRCILEILRLGTRRINIHDRLKPTRIIQTGSLDDDDLWPRACSRVLNKDGRATLAAKPSAHVVPAVCLHVIIRWFTLSERESRGRHDQSYGEGATAGLLAIATMTIERRERFSRT